MGQQLNKPCVTRKFIEVSGNVDFQTSFNDDACEALHKQWIGKELSDREEELIKAHEEWAKAS